MLVMLVHSGAAFYVFALFYMPLYEEFGWTRVEVACGMTIYLLTLAFTAPFIGKLTARVGPKKMILGGAILAGGAFVLLSRMTALWQFYTLYFVLGLAFSACGAIPVTTTVANWFVKKLGTAIGIMMVGVSLGAFTVVPLGALILEAYGWRATYLFLAALTFALVIPPLLLVVKESPGELGASPDGHLTNRTVSSTGEPLPIETPSADVRDEWTLARASKTFPFWALCVSFYLIFYGIGAILQHQINYLNDIGISITSAAIALGVTGGVGGLGKIVFGFVSDRFSPKSVTAVCCAMQALGILVLLFTWSVEMVWLFAIVFGFSMGGQMALQPLIVRYFFGFRSFGIMYGIALMASTIGEASGPVLAAMIYDTFGSYHWAFLSCLVAALVASFLIFIARRPEFEGITQKY